MARESFARTACRHRLAAGRDAGRHSSAVVPGVAAVVCSSAAGEEVSSWDQTRPSEAVQAGVIASHVVAEAWVWLADPADRRGILRVRSARLRAWAGDFGGTLERGSLQGEQWMRSLDHDWEVEQ
jgi:hypothetical protein